MSLADELLNKIDPENSMDQDSNGDIVAYNNDQHIVIGKDRFITVPDSLKRIAVQNDHDIETVTFDCPRYWDDHDMSKMKIYINYICADNEQGCYAAKNVTVDSGDERIMHFDWTISKNITMSHGKIAFLVCIKNTSEDGQEINHWNSEICKDCYVSEGLEFSDGNLEEIYPDILDEWHKEVLSVLDDIIEAKNNGEFIGDPGVSPTIEVYEINRGHRVEITDINGTKSFDVKDTIVDSTEAVNELLNTFVYKDKVFHAKSNDGITYYIDDADFQEIVGVSYVIIPSKTSEDCCPELVVNGKEPKYIVVKSNEETAPFAEGSGFNPEWLTSGMPIKITFLGQYWLADFTVVQAYYLYGTVPVENGGTGEHSLRHLWRPGYLYSLISGDDIMSISFITYDDAPNCGKYCINKAEYDSNHSNHFSIPDSRYFPFKTDWTNCTLLIEDATGSGCMATSDIKEDSVGYFKQTLESDNGEKYTRIVSYDSNGNLINRSDWNQCYTSNSPIVLSSSNYGNDLPIKGTEGQIFIKFFEDQGHEYWPAKIYMYRENHEVLGKGWIPLL